ncbi:MAG: biosynthetic-type acetolactate synthase large subunit [Dehalococcoidia bacterium]|nr:biosynthetic-type acetolactate synthase large subunit [Dehalococcoidia bacterium]
MMMNGAQILCECLMREGVDVIFGLTGGAVVPMYDAFSEYPRIRRVLVRHEQGAAHAAAGYARAMQRAGVCVATSGPGATNLVTGIADAYMDSTPLVVITGQVNDSSIGKDTFQECDITGITLPVIKHNYLVRDVKDLARIMKEAFHIAQTGRPGPVLVDIPRDIQVATTEFSYPTSVSLRGYRVANEADPAQVALVAELLNGAERPVVIAGRGTIISGAYAELLELVETMQAPVVHTLLGLGSFPPQHPLDLGMIGMHGSGYANRAVQHADLVLALGTRFGDRATMKASGFAPEAVVVHVDIDHAEIAKNIVPFAALVGDVKAVLKQLNPLLTVKDRSEWFAQVNKWRIDHPLNIHRPGKRLSAREVIRTICRSVDDTTIITTGVGQHQMFAAQEYASSRRNGFITSGGLGTMGFELPAAMGAQVACPEETVWAIAGDGSLQMTIQELATIGQENLPVKIAVLNNGYHGMVRQLQEVYCGSNYVDVALRTPDFVMLAKAYGIPAMRVGQMSEVAGAIESALACPGAFLIEFAVEPEENVLPMCVAGASLDEMIESTSTVSQHRKELMSVEKLLIG